MIRPLRRPASRILRCTLAIIDGVCGIVMISEGMGLSLMLPRYGARSRLFKMIYALLYESSGTAFAVVAMLVSCVSGIILLSVFDVPAEFSPWLRLP